MFLSVRWYLSEVVMCCVVGAADREMLLFGGDMHIVFYRTTGFYTTSWPLVLHVFLHIGILQWRPAGRLPRVELRGILALLLRQFLVQPAFVVLPALMATCPWA